MIAARGRTGFTEGCKLVSQDTHRKVALYVDCIRWKEQFPGIGIPSTKAPALALRDLLHARFAGDWIRATDLQLHPTLIALSLNLQHLEICKANERGGQLENVFFLQGIGGVVEARQQSLAHLFSPEVIVIGGGLGLTGDLLYDPLRAALADHGPRDLPEPIRIARAELGDDAGLIGASGWASTFDPQPMKE